MDSKSAQIYDQNKITQPLRAVYIVEDEDAGDIVAGGLKILIPEGANIIFNDEQSEGTLTFSGDAVEEGKVGDASDAYWDDRDASIVIPIIQDFDPNDQLIIAGLFVEGFYEPSFETYYLELYMDDKKITEDVQYIRVRESQNSDNYKPEVPVDLNLSLTETGVNLKWVDPTDRDLSLIQVYRSVGENNPFQAYAEVAPGVESLLDDNLEEGDLVKYQLRATDGRNFSDVSEVVSITVDFSNSESTEEETEEQPEEETTETPDNTEESDDSSDTEDVEPEATEEDESSEDTPDFTDTTGHWAKADIDFMAQADVIRGRSETSFAPNESLNRAEAAAMIYRIYDAADAPDPSETDSFSDVEVSAWYSAYVNALAELELANGNPDGTYEPSETMNRAEFLQLAMNLYEELVEDPYTAWASATFLAEDLPFFDDNDEDAWYTYMADTAYLQDFVTGEACDAGLCFNPARSISRAEAATILKRMFGDYLSAR